MRGAEVNLQRSRIGVSCPFTAAAGGWLGGGRRALLATVVAAGLASAPATTEAGAFIFAGEANGVDLVAHPSGYTGNGGTLGVSVCVDPSSPHANEMGGAIQRVVATWNARTPTSPNLLLGGTNDIPSGGVDLESTALHEVGHCIGLAHPNLASESGLSEPERNYTRSTLGADSAYDTNTGADGVIGSGDDQRDDDTNLHWYQIGANNPFAIAGTVDSSTYRRTLTGLPAGHAFAANGDRGVAALLGVPNTEAVMQQGAFFDEDQRRLTHDDVATIRYAMSGLDEIAGTADDYDLVLSYAGLTTACDVVLAFDDSETGFAVCQVTGSFIGSTGHARITGANIFFNTGFDWFFGSAPPVCGNGTLEAGEECDDGDTLGGDCCSASCSFEPNGSTCDDGDACTESDTCDGAGTCQGGTPLSCDDGLFCNGTETCDTGTGCVSGAVPCAGGACDETTNSCPGPAELPSFEQIETGLATSQASVATDAALQAASNGLYLASISTRPPRAVQTVSGLGLQWSELRSQCAGRNQTGIAVWMAYGSPAQSTAVTAQLESSATSAVITATRYSGVDGAAPVGAVVSANTNGASGACDGGSDSDAYSLLMPVSAPGAIAYGAAAMRNKRHSPGAGFTERAEVQAGNGGNMASGAVEDRVVAEPGTISVDGTFHRSVDWAVIAVEILPPTGPCGDDADCSDGIFCNGAELCASGVCVGGGAIDCDDGVGCTLDTCDETLDTCANTPNHASCSDPLFCNGAEICDPLLDCQPGSDPCPETTCDEGTDTCGCTNDAECSDALFCNGTESCSGGTCVAGTPIACDDAVLCTIDSCDEAQDDCVFAPDDAICTDGLFCSGAETCDPQDGCQPGVDPCAGTTCDEGADVCEGSGGSVALEQVTSGAATSSASVTTDAALAAVAGDLYLAAVSTRRSVPVSGVSGLGLAWSQVRSQCAGRGQTAISLWAAQGVPTTAESVSASFSNSSAAAAIAAARYSGTHPSAPLESVVSGNTNGSDGACSGGSDGAAYAFPVSVSSAGSAVFGAASMRNKRHEPGAGFTEQVEVAAGSSGDVASTAVQDLLALSAGAAVLDGSFSSNVDWAVVGVVIAAGGGGPPPSGCASDAECSDGQFCNGEELCDAGTCVAGTAPSCDDGIDCTIDACNETTDGCEAAPNDATCDDGQFCSGAETCSPLLGCQPGSDPCGGLTCDESSNTCAGGSGDVQFEEVQTGGAVGASTVQTQTSVAAVAGDLYLASISFRRDAAVIDVQGLGLTWTPIRTQCGARNQAGISLWWAQGSPAASGPVSASFASAPAASAISVTRYSGVNPTSPVGGVVSANTLGLNGACSGGTDTATYSLPLSVGSSGAVAYGTASMRNRRHEPGTTYTERAEILAGSGGDVSSNAVQDRSVATPAALPVDGSFSRDVDWAVIAVEIRP